MEAPLFWSRAQGNVAALALALVLAAGCKAKAWTKTSDAASAPEGAKFARATARVSFVPGVSGIHSSTSDHLLFELQLDGAPGGKIDLDDAYEGDAEWAAMRKPDFALRFAPEGKALAVSLDGGKSYRFVSFETDPPLYCRHERFSLDGGWAAMPDMRRVVLDILATTDPPGPSHSHLAAGETPRVRWRYEKELEGAVQYACAHLDDADLRKGVVDCILGEGSQLDITTLIATVTECGGKVAQRDTALRATLLAALEKGSVDSRMRAAQTLSSVDDAAVQSALSRVLSTVKPCVLAGAADTPEAKRCRDDAFERDAFLWSLARVTLGLGSVPPDQVQALVDLTRDPQPRVAIHAARMLSVAAQPAARARLAELAAKECFRPIRWSEDFRSWTDSGGPDDMPCWARAALDPSKKSE